MNESADRVKRPRVRGALKLIRGELEALSSSCLESINLEPLSAVATVRGAIPKILLLRDEIATTLPLFELGHIDRLELYALAFMAAHSYYCAAKGLEKERVTLAAETNELRKRLWLDFNSLRERRLLPQARTVELKGPNGHLNIASDAMTMGNLLRDNWDAISGYCACSLADLDQAEMLADSLIRAVGDRARTPVEVTAATLQRQQAFTLFVRAYSEVRAAVLYVCRADPEAKKLVPSLYCKRKRAAQAARDAAAVKGSPLEPTQPDASELPTATETESKDPVENPFLH